MGRLKRYGRKLCPGGWPVAKELNRRTASKASRYIFHCKNETWVMPFIKKEGI